METAHLFYWEYPLGSVPNYIRANRKGEGRVIPIMNDSDNTGESSVSHVDYLEIFR